MALFCPLRFSCRPGATGVTPTAPAAKIND
jgi:hypothetical protein